MCQNKILFSLFVLLLLLIACAPVPPPETLTPTLVPTATNTPLPTDTPMPTQTSTPTQHHTVTPFPTLAPSEALEYITEMFETNGGCKLPCWWGITPGITTWEMAKQKLAPIAREINKLGLPGYYGVIIDPPKEIYQGYGIGGTFYIEMGVIQEIDIGYVYGYPISRMLDEHGSPTEIYIQAAFYTRIEPPVNFNLVLFYENQGILALYLGGAEYNEVFQICPSNIFDPDFVFAFLWSPETHKKFEDFWGIVPIGDMTYFRLEEATNIDVEIFVELYKDPDSAACFEMPDPDL